MKKNIKRVISVLSIAAGLMSTDSMKAQYDAMFTQYMFNEMFINPAYAGSKEAMSATLLHRQQWMNFPGRPITTSFSLHGPLMDNKMGLGLSFLNEKIGVLTRNLIYGTYAYRLKVEQDAYFSMGLMAGIDNQVNRLSQVSVSDVVGAPADPNFAQNNLNMTGGNFGAGVYYNTKTFFAGLSVPRMLDNQVKTNFNNTKVITITKLDPTLFTYYLTVGNVFKLNDDLRLKGTAMLKAVKSAPMQLDVAASAFIKEMIWAGLAYRTNSSMSIILGVQANKQLLVSYSYDYGLNRIQTYSQGSHEIAVNYLFSFKSRKVITPRYF
jgi:type IX secretion system PorP/SprF family membrane protein